MTALPQLARPVAWRVRNVRDRWREHRRGPVASADDYWSDPTRPTWRENSHWRDAPTAEFAARWAEIGASHRAMYARFARTFDLTPPRRILEWGVGGGANAVRFAPLCETFVAVDIAPASLDETVHQVAAVSDVDVLPVLVSLDDQRGPVAGLAGSIDLFLCFYVLELVPSPAHAEEIVRLAHELLRPGGAAILQVKYHRSGPRPRPWRAPGSDLANRYVVDIEEFWQLLVAAGFDVHYVELVPENPLDKHYAYFCVTTPEGPPRPLGRAEAVRA